MIPSDAFGPGDFMMIRAELVRVVGGAAEALVAATIYWRASLVNANAYEHEGYVWWRATQEDIANLTGMSRDQVGRAGRALMEAGHVVVERHQRAGIQDRSYSYRVVSDTPIVRNRTIEGAESHDVEGAESHDVSVKTEKTEKNKRAVRLPADWMPSNAHSLLAASLKVDLDLEAEKFKDYCVANGRSFVDWDAAFRNWLRRAAEQPRQRPDTQQRRGRDDEIRDLLQGNLGLDNKETP